MLKTTKEFCQDLEGYLENINEENFEAIWDPVGRWHQCHGDTKSSKGGLFVITSMKINEGEHQARVLYTGRVAFTPITLGVEVRSMFTCSPIRLFASTSTSSSRCAGRSKKKLYSS